MLAPSLPLERGLPLFLISNQSFILVFSTQITQQTYFHATLPSSMNFLHKSKSSLSSLLSRCISNQINPQIQQSRSSTYYILHPQPKTQYYRFRRQPRWYHNPRNVIAVVLVSSAAGASIYYGNLETVPYTKRRHFVLISPSVERQLGEAQFNQLKNALRGKTLSPIHPDSVRVRLISNEIISALQRGLHHHEPHWNSIEYSSHEPSEEDFDPKRSPETILLLEDDCKEKHLKWPPEVEELMNDRWVQASRDMDSVKGGTLPEMRHMDGLKWEVLVVRDKMVNAFCLPGGKIVVFTGLLDHFRTDEEIATVLGHEVGHAIARHSAEMITKNLWFAVLQLIILQFVFMPDIISAMSNLLLRLPFSRKMEIEADHIGLLLMASAGFDPRVAPLVYEKLGKITGDSALHNYLSTHPSSKKRAEILSRAEVMEEALELYRETVAGCGIMGFL